MITRRLIPCLDVAEGRVVKGVRFAGLRDAGDPVERASYYEATGADEIVLLDVRATLSERDHGIDVIRRLRDRLRIPLTVGGGVRSTRDAAALLAAGADKVAINTAAVLNPELLSAMAERFGRQSTVLAVDARARGGSWEVVVRGGTTGTGRQVIAWVEEACARGAGEILLTSWDRDGTGQGYDLQLIGAVRAAVSVPLIASGGASGVADFTRAFARGADAVLAASIFHNDKTTVAEVKRRLAALGIEVRR